MQCRKNPRSSSVVLGLVFSFASLGTAALLWGQPPAEGNGTDYASLETLAGDFWTWRAVHQPENGDDIPRLDRLEGWFPDWSRTTMAARRSALAGFKTRYPAIHPTGWDVPRQVDYRLVGSALARVDWELEKLVPMPRTTAEEEAAFFASSPGQAISYQIGKLEIANLLPEFGGRKGRSSTCGSSRSSCSSSTESLKPVSARTRDNNLG
ncbi:MAG: hypothetical protein GY854_22395 [Deltaproteobacteria bacterium]|nr:hypothetical protein [Deltaproteobacteria bacterium]